MNNRQPPIRPISNAKDRNDMMKEYLGFNGFKPSNIDMNVMCKMLEEISNEYHNRRKRHTDVTAENVAELTMMGFTNEEIEKMLDIPHSKRSRLQHSRRGLNGIDPSQFNRTVDRIPKSQDEIE